MALHMNFNMASQSTTNLNTMPIANPPEGQNQDFINNPGSHTDAMLGISSIFLALMLAAVSVRCYTKARILRQWTWDDVTLALGTAGTLGVFVLLVLYAVMERMGSHVWNIPIATVASPSWSMQNDCFDTLVPLTMGFVKLTFFVYLYDLLKASRKARICIIIGIFLTTLFYLSITITQLAIWVPTKGAGSINSMTSGTALQLSTVLLIASCGGFALDIFIFSIPLLSLHRLQLEGYRCLGVATIFLVGLMAISASLVTLVYRSRLNDLSDGDFLYYAMPTVLCTQVELCSGIIASSLPCTVTFFSCCQQKRTLRRYGSTLDRKDFPLASRAEDTSFSTPGAVAGWTKGLQRKASIVSGVNTLVESGPHSLSKTSADNLGRRRSGSIITALPEIGVPVEEMMIQEDDAPPRPTSADAVHIYGAMTDDDNVEDASEEYSDLQARAHKLTVRSFENFKAVKPDAEEIEEALKCFPPTGSGAQGAPTNRFAFGD